MYTFFAIITSGIVSTLIRVLPVSLIQKPIQNKFLKSFLYYVPFVTLSVMTFPSILHATDSVFTGIMAFILGIILSFMNMGLFIVAVCLCAFVLIFEFFFPVENASITIKALTQVDFKILDFIQIHFRTPFFDIFFKFFTMLGNLGVFWILCSLLLLIFKKYRKTAIFAICSMLLAFIVFQGILKPLIGRARPFIQNPDFIQIIKPPFSSSFPSGHSAIAFAFTASLFLSKTKLWISALVISVLIAFSRIYLYVHFPSDVISGLLVGILCAVSVFLLMRKITGKKNNAVSKK